MEHALAARRLPLFRRTRFSTAAGPTFGNRIPPPPPTTRAHAGAMLVQLRATRWPAVGSIAIFTAIVAWSARACGEDADELSRYFAEDSAPELERYLPRSESTRTPENDFIETDRNSFTFARMTAGANRLIVETSFSFINISGQKLDFSFPETLFRYGIGDRFELRLGWNYETGSERVPGANNIGGFFAANAEQQLYYGFKAALSEQSGLLPGSALFVQGHTPTGGAQSVTQLRTGYVVGWRLPNRWDFDAAMRFGTDIDEYGGYRIYAPSCVLKIPLTESERWFAHVEYFGVLTQGKESDVTLNFIDIGLHHLFTSNIEVGAIVAFGPHSGGMNLVTNVGIGVRF